MPERFKVCGDWLTGVYLVVSLNKDDTYSVALTSRMNGKMLLARPSMCRCEGQGCQRQGWHRAASKERYVYH